MKKNWTALLCTGALILAGCGSSTAAQPEEKPAVDEIIEETEKERETTPPASSSSSKITADDSGYAYGYIGDTMRNAFFDFVVNDAYSTDKFETYTAAEGMKLVVVNMTIKNTFRGSTPMFASDFYIVWDWDNEKYSVPINDEHPELTLGDMLPDTYSLGINESRTGTLVYEIGKDTKDCTLLFDEYFENEEWGDTYVVDFTVD